jgi:hypothetical protein
LRWRSWRVALLIRYRISSSRAATASAIENLTNARESISQLQNSARFQLPPLELAAQRRTIFFRCEPVAGAGDEPRR